MATVVYDPLHLVHIQACISGNSAFGTVRADGGWVEIDDYFAF